MEIKLSICTSCMEQIKLFRKDELWEHVCIRNILEGGWVECNYDESIAPRIKELENLRYLTTTEHNDKIIVKANGIYHEFEGYYSLCICR